MIDTIGSRIADYAQRLIGRILEEYPYENRGAEVDALNDSAGAPLGSPWCASFAGNCFRTQGAVIPAGYAACEAWHRLIVNDTAPEVGDAILYNFDGGPIAHHMGIVWRVLRDRILVVEGNTSILPTDREGFGVFLKERTPGVSRAGILGYIHPTAYPGPVPGPPPT